MSVNFCHWTRMCYNTVFVHEYGILRSDCRDSRILYQNKVLLMYSIIQIPEQMSENRQQKSRSHHSGRASRGRQRCSEPFAAPESSNGSSPPFSSTCTTCAPPTCAPVAASPTSSSAPCSRWVKSGSSRRSSTSPPALVRSVSELLPFVSAAAAAVEVNGLQPSAASAAGGGGASVVCVESVLAEEEEVTPSVGESANRCTSRSLLPTAMPAVVNLRTFETDSHSFPEICIHTEYTNTCSLYKMSNVERGTTKSRAKEYE